MNSEQLKILSEIKSALVGVRERLDITELDLATGVEQINIGYSACDGELVPNLIVIHHRKLFGKHSPVQYIYKEGVNDTFNTGWKAYIVNTDIFQAALEHVNMSIYHLQFGTNDE